jgi:hypothetical protein
MLIYLKDHLAVAVAATEVAKRCLSSNPTDLLAAYLRRLVADLGDERTTMERVLKMLGGSSALPWGERDSTDRRSLRFVDSVWGAKNRVSLATWVSRSAHK